MSLPSYCNIAAETPGNYRGRHEWEATGKVVGFGPQTTVYAPKVDANSDPIDTGRAVFVKEGKADMHYPDKTTLHVDPSPEDATMRGTGKLVSPSFTLTGIYRDGLSLNFL